MTHDMPIVQALVYLLSAVITVPIAKRLGLGSVLGYLLGGVAIGPYVLGLVGKNSAQVMNFSTFGIIILLFVIGLELRPSLLWRLRHSIFGMGLAQVLLTSLVVTGIALALKLSFAMALAIGMILSLSSTAIVLQTLSEKGWLKSKAGNVSFAVLLFQDIAVIPMIAILPLLAVKHTQHTLPIDNLYVLHLTRWEKALLIAVIIAAIIVVGRFLVRPILRYIANSKLHEIFTAVTLLIVVLVVFAMKAVDLSPALGAFLAGVILAESEYKHELEANIEPFKSLLLGLFFISVGATINFSIVINHPWLILGLVIALVTIKFLTLLIVGKLFKMPISDNLLFSFALLQGGEFCFVLLSYALQNHILTPDIANPLVVVVALSMLSTPFFIFIYEKILEPKFIKEQDQREQDTITHESNPVIIAGFGRFGQIVGRLLMLNGFNVTVLDLDPNHVDLVRNFGYKIFYGDAARLELLRAANIEQAKLFVIAIDNSEKATEIAELVRKHYPHVKLLIRVRGRTQAYDLIKLGFDNIYRETFDTSLRMSIDALQTLGFSKEKANDVAKLFKEHDEKVLRNLANVYGDQATYMSEIRKSKQNLEEVFKTDASNSTANIAKGNQ